MYNAKDLEENLDTLSRMYQDGLLGGDVMPEDARPECILLDSPENIHFLTLPMALNYQRNSYTLWEAAAQTYMDAETRNVFYPHHVIKCGKDVLRQKLLKYKLALQPNKHIDTWYRICEILVHDYEGCMKNLLLQRSCDVASIKKLLQKEKKRYFPYLSGEKICNYWLYVLTQYTHLPFKNMEEITIAPDTHVIQSTIKLGLSSMSEEVLSTNRKLVSDIWYKQLSNTKYKPIDVHHLLWLWSRKGFPKIN